jgi:hypothetical protein
VLKIRWRMLRYQKTYENNRSQEANNVDKCRFAPAFKKCFLLLHFYSAGKVSLPPSGLELSPDFVFFTSFKLLKPNVADTGIET